MPPSGVDYFARLIRTLAVSATQQPASQSLIELTQALMRLPAESSERVAYNSAMDHAAALSLNPAIKGVEEDHIEDYRLGDPETDSPKQFVEHLILEIDNLIDEAELGASDEICAHANDAVNVKANETAREIASKRATEGAREAAEEAYKLAYEWAYDDLFEEAYNQALRQLS